MLRVWSFRRYKYVYVCTQECCCCCCCCCSVCCITAVVAAACCCCCCLLLLAAAAFCCCLLLLFVIVHLPPGVVLHTMSSIVVPTVNFFVYERKYVSSPLGSTVAFVRPRLSYTIYLSWPLRPCAEPCAGVSSPRRSPACTYIDFNICVIFADIRVR